MSALPLTRIKACRDVERDTRYTFEGLLVALFSGLLFWSALGLVGAALSSW